MAIGKFITTLFLLTGFVNSKAQVSIERNKTYHILSIKSGINQIKEANLHSKVNTGSIIELSYGFERNKSNLKSFRFSIGYSRLKTKLEDLSASVNLKLNTSYSLNVILFQKKNIKFYLGPKISLAYSAAYFPQWDDSHLYWGNYFSVGANTVGIIKFKNKNELISSLSIPLFNLYSRPDYLRLYKIDNIGFGGIVKLLNSNIKPGFWDHAFETQFETSYRFQAFSNKAEEIFFSFEFLRIAGNEGKPLTQISNQLGIKFLL